MQESDFLWPEAVRAIEAATWAAIRKARQMGTNAYGVFKTVLVFGIFVVCLMSAGAFAEGKGSAEIILNGLNACRTINASSSLIVRVVSP